MRDRHDEMRHPRFWRMINRRSARWLKLGKTRQGHDLWEKPNGERMIVRIGVEPLVPVRSTSAPTEGAPDRARLRRNAALSARKFAPDYDAIMFGSGSCARSIVPAPRTTKASVE